MAETVKGLTPAIGVIQTRPTERVLGRYLNARVSTKPLDVTFADLLSDAFWARYKARPETREEVPPERSVNKLLMDWVMQQDGWEQSRSYTVGNLLPAITSASMLYEMLSTDATLQEALKAQSEAEKAAAQADQEDEKAAKSSMKGDADAQARHEAEANAARQRAKDLAAGAIKTIDSLMKNPLAQGMASAAVKGAGKQAEQTRDMMAGWGLGDGSDIGYGEIGELLQLLFDKGNKLAKIGELVGKLKGVSKDKIEHARLNSTNAVTEMALTQDPMRIIPTELAMLSEDAPELLRAEKVGQFLDHGLLGWRPTNQGQIEGAFVAMTDVSGSMNGMPEIIAKAVALAIAKALTEQQADSNIKRRYILGLFASNEECPIVTSEHPWRQHLEWATINNLGGGTDFDFALSTSVTLLKSLASDGVKGADLLFISDGEGWVSPNVKELWREYKSETGSRIVYVQIGRQNYYEAMREVSDLNIEVSDLEDSTINNLVEQISGFVIDHEIQGWGGD